MRKTRFHVHRYIMEKITITDYKSTTATDLEALLQRTISFHRGNLVSNPPPITPLESSAELLPVGRHGTSEVDARELPGNSIKATITKREKSLTRAQHFYMGNKINQTLKGRCEIEASSQRCRMYIRKLVLMFILLVHTKYTKHACIVRLG